jgi:hypothetical protein
MMGSFTDIFDHYSGVIDIKVFSPFSFRTLLSDGHLYLKEERNIYSRLAKRKLKSLKSRHAPVPERREKYLQ